MLDLPWLPELRESSPLSHASGSSRVLSCGARIGICNGPTAMSMDFPRVVPLAAALALAACDDASSLPEGDNTDSADTFAAATCSRSMTTTLGDSSEELTSFVVKTRHITTKNVGKLSDKIRNQLIGAFVQLELAAPGDVVAELVESADDGTVDLLDVTLTSEDPELRADWISFHSGDRELGVVFANNTTEVMARINDGAVEGCTRSKECGGPSALRCADDEYCDFASACGEGGEPGECKKRPAMCLDGFDPVCACDGKTHSNECEANAAGTDVPDEC